MSNLQLIRLDQLPESTQAVLREVVECLEQRFTGDLRVDFKDGVPQVQKRTETLRYHPERLTK